MNDLILVLNSKESRRIGISVVETYLCNNKIDKNGKYIGGILGKININEIDESNNILKNKLDILRKYLNENAYHISKYQFIIEADKFEGLFNIIQTKDIFFYQTKDNDFIKIIEVTKNLEYKEKRNNEINKLINEDVIFIRYLYILTFHLKNKNRKKIENNPIPELIKYSNEKNRYLLNFDYMGIEVAPTSKEKIINNKDSIIIRNYNEEIKNINFINALGYKKISQNIYSYNGNKEICKVEEELIKNNFKILDMDSNKKSKNIYPKIKIIDSSNDWFEINLSYKYNNEVYNLASKIDLYSNKKYVVLDDKKIVDLPKSIYNNLDKLSISNDKLFLKKKYFWSFLEIANESNQNISKFTTYSNISVKLSDLLCEKIKDYQIEGVKWLKWLYINKLGGCLADDMGLGKTLQVIAMLSEEDIRKNLTKVLIIVPKALIVNWQREFDKFSSNFNIVVYHGENRKDLLKSQYDIMITTYNIATNDIVQLKNIFFDIIIFDEIQVIKNNKTKKYKELSKLEAKSRIGLSGTPMENNIGELWNIFNIINPDMLCTKEKFKKKYNIIENHDELRKLLTPFILRRTKKEVLSELPEKYEEIIYCNFSEQEKILYDSIKVALKNALLNSSTVNNGLILKGLVLLREICCHPQLLSNDVNVNEIEESSKFEILKLKLVELNENGHKVIVFSQFAEMLKIIKIWAEKEKINTFYIDGKTSNRQEIIDEFQKSNNGIFLITLKVGGVGLNLTTAQDVIIYEPWWNPFVEMQAEDRVYRIGQEKEVTVYKMIVADSIEEKMLNLQTDKKQIFDDIINKISSNKNIDLKELIKLL